MDQLYGIGRAAALLGVHPDTIRRWEGQGRIRILRTPGGKRRIPESEIRRLRGGEALPLSQRVLAIYGRVSSHEQKARGDLDRQVAYIRAAMAGQGFDRIIEVTDVASGLSDRRRGLLRLMEMARQGEITDVAVTYKDRLTRFGFGYLAQYFASHGVRLHGVDGQEDRKSLQAELVDDLLAIVTSFAGKLYGLRSHRKARELVSAVKAVVANAGDVPDENPG